MKAEQDSAGQEKTHNQRNVIVLVEDNPQIRYIISSFVDVATSYHVQAYSDGQDVLHHVDDLCTQQPVLLLLDYHLPTMTGVQLYDHLQHIEGLGHVPALIITAESSLLIEKELAQRHLGILSKPFSLKELLAALAPLLP